MAEEPPFALAPALINPDAYLDYSTRYGQSLYTTATAPLPRKFDGKPANVLPFLQTVADRAASSGWEAILTINVGGDDPNWKDLLTEYGQIQLQDIIENAEDGYIGQPVRSAQASHQLYQCLTHSITEELGQRMVTRVEDYTIEGVPDGPAYLKVLLDLSMVETPATIRQLRENLLRLEDKIEDTFKSNIVDFNQYVSVQLRHLAARGETTHDLLNSLLTAYLRVNDNNFKKYIMSKKDDHDDGTTPLSPERLMFLAKSKFESLEQEGKWLTPDEATQQIIAMTAELETLRKQVKNASASTSKPHTKRGKPSNYKEQRDKEGKYKKATSSQGHRPSKPKGRDGDKWAWKDVPPKTGEAKVKNTNGKKYHWCHHHKRWTLHKPEECNLKTDETETPQKEEGQTQPEAQQARLEAMACIVEQVGFQADLE